MFDVWQADPVRLGELIAEMRDVGEAREASAVPSIDGYQVLCSLGEGGMGTVWRARQLGTGRVVALKLMSAATLGSVKARARFEREIELTARLQHPHIARLYDSGVYRGVYFYAMELIEGRKLDEYVEQEALSRRRIIELMAFVCDAIQHAHQNGVIHRDLKPSNIMVTSDGQPHVLDFGLATAFQQMCLSASMTFEIAGTLGFMSPEQASGRRDEIDTRSDVYSLGVVLYRVLTGAMPHDLEGTPLEMMRRLSEQQARRPTRVDPTVDTDLEAILLKSLSKDREQRYGTAGELGSDLRRYLRGDPVSARPPTLSYFAGKRLRRYRPQIIIAGVILAALAGLTVVAVLRIRQERNVAVVQRLLAQQQRTAAESMRNLAETRLADSLVAQGNALAQTQSWVEAKERYREAYDALRAQGRETFEADVQLSLALGEAPPPLQIFEGHDGAVTATAIAAGNRLAASGSEDHTIKLWDVVTAHCVRTLTGPAAAVTCLAFVPDGSLLLAGDKDGNVFAWDVASGREAYARRNRYGIVSLCCNSDGTRVMTICSDNTAAIWDAHSGVKVCDLEVRLGEQVYGAGAFALDGLRCLCACSADFGLSWWDAQSGRRLNTLGSTPAGVSSVAISPDGKWAAVGQAVARAARVALIYDLGSGKCVRSLAGRGSGSQQIAFTSDSNFVLAVGTDGTVTRWNVSTGEADANVWGDQHSLQNVSFSTDGSLVLSGAPSGSADHTMKLWTFPAPRGARSVWLPRSTGAACSPDGRLLFATCQDDGDIWVRDVATGMELSKLSSGGSSSLRSVAVSPDGRWLLSGAADGNVWLWDLKTGASLGAIGKHENEVWSLAFSPDSRFAISHSGSQLAYWDISQRRLLRMIHSDRVLGRAIRFSEDGAMAIGVNTHANIMRWRLSTGEIVPLAEYQQREFYPCEGGASLDLPSGRGVVGNNSDVLVWDRFVAGPRRALSGHQGAVQATAIWPGGKWGATGANDSTIRLWDIERGREIGALGGTFFPIMCVTLSPDGRQLFAAGQDGVQFCDLSLAAEYRDSDANLASLRRSLKANPDEPMALGMLGRWYAFRRADAWAVECLERARRGGAAISHLMLARCYWQLNQTDPARREFRMAEANREAPDHYLDLCTDAVTRSGAQ